MGWILYYNKCKHLNSTDWVGTRHYSKGFPVISVIFSTTLGDQDITNTIPNIGRSKLRHGEDKKFFQVPRARKRQSWDSNPGSLAWGSTILTAACLLGRQEHRTSSQEYRHRFYSGCSRKTEASLQLSSRSLPPLFKHSGSLSERGTLKAVADAKMQRCYGEKSDFQADTQSVF